jgi:hypothetical protein
VIDIFQIARHDEERTQRERVQAVDRAMTEAYRLVGRALDAADLRIRISEQAASQIRDWFNIDPGDLYPPALAHVKEALAFDKPDGALAQEWDHAQMLPPDIWDRAATEAREDFDDEGLAARAEALEIARRWFTELLHRSVGAPLGLHVTKDERWRL